MRERFEVRFNGYLPQNKRFLVNSSSINNATKLTRVYDASIGTQGQTTQTIDYNVNTSNRYEVPLAGFDAELGGNILSRLETHGAYYHFNGRKGAKSVNGWRFRSILYLFNKKNQRLDIQGELNYDNVRKWSNYLGIKLSWLFGKSNSKFKRNSIEDKMTQMTVRDVDIISTDSNENIKSSISSTQKQDGFSAMLLTDDDIKELGLENAEIVGIGETIFTEASGTRLGGGTGFIGKIHSMRNASGYNLIGVLTKEQDGTLVFVPQLNSDNSINIDANEKIANLLNKAGKDISNVLARTNEQKQGLVKLFNQGEFNSQDNSLSAQIARRQKWEEVFNKTIKQNHFALTTEELVNNICRVYGFAIAGDGYHAAPIIITDPVSDRRLGLPGVYIVLKLPKEAYNNLPDSLKSKIVNSGININNELDIFYVAQNLKFGATAPPINNNELARVRFHPYVHTDSPETPTVNYDRKSYMKTFFAKVDGSNLTEIDIGHNNKGLVWTHNSGANTDNKWSPPETMGVPPQIYGLTNFVPNSYQSPGAFYSLGIREQENAVTLGNRVVVT
ncbi:MAG: hypothetical protein HRT87_07455 [Legionellales bacterium]|nr:hypothetical protein [Legionellales bacterium]